MPQYITDNAEVSSDEKNPDKENADEENWDEEDWRLFDSFINGNQSPNKIFCF